MLGPYEIQSPLGAGACQLRKLYEDPKHLPAGLAIGIKAITFTLT